MTAADLLDLIEACAAFAIPGMLGFCIGRSFPRERETVAVETSGAEKVGAFIFSQIHAVHDTLAFCGNEVTVTRNMVITTPGKATLKLQLTNATEQVG